MKKLIVAVLFILAFAIAPSLHAQTCNQTPFNYSAGGIGSTVTVFIPGDGSPGSGCTKIYIDIVSAILSDQTENCLQLFTITQGVIGSNITVYRDMLLTSTDTSDHQISRLPFLGPFLAPNWLWFSGHTGGGLQFSGHCPNSYEFINVVGHYAP